MSRFLSCTVRISVACLIVMITLSAFGQVVELSESYHSYRKIHWRGYNLIDTSGTYHYSRPVGLWKYWHENGKKSSEIIYVDNDERYVNMWLPNGKRMLKNGNGIYISTDPFSHFVTDSCVYQIVDSLKNGWSICYFKREGSDSLATSAGYYRNNEKHGTFIYTDKRTTVSNFIDGKQTGEYIVKTLLGKTLVEGNTIDGYNSGKWTYYFDNGCVEKICHFAKGTLKDEYIEYYENGSIKTEGIYVHASGLVNAVIIDPATNEEHTEEQFRNDILARNGTWNSYDSTGKLIKSETYYNEIVRD